LNQRSKEQSVPKTKNGPNGKNNTSSLGLEAKLWQAADALRNNMDAAEYKHVVLGLIFLKYISDAFEAKHAELESQRTEGGENTLLLLAAVSWIFTEWSMFKRRQSRPSCYGSARSFRNCDQT
jgi:type I restriction-modification system DNA methylase subunit